jgi:hypothetical protein
MPALASTMYPNEYTTTKIPWEICRFFLKTFVNPSVSMASSSNQPNTTLYINNLNDKVNKDELRIQLYALFTTYGKVIDIVASKSQQMRGQAFLVFTDLAGATSAMRACAGMMFYDKPLVSPFSSVSDNWMTSCHISGLIMPNQNLMPHCEGRTHYLFPLPLPTQALLQRRTRNDKEMMRLRPASGMRSGKRQKRMKRKWK